MSVLVGQFLEQLAALCFTETVAADWRTGRNFDVRTRYVHEPLELRSAQRAGLPLTIGHDADQVVGRVQHLELGGQRGDAWAVCDLDVELPGVESLYFSLEARGPLHDAQLTALGITGRPAAVGLPPLRIFPGGVRDADEAMILRMRRTEPHLAGLLRRAKAAARGRRFGDPLTVEDPSRPAVEGRGWSGSSYERPLGPIEHSPWPGRILSVR